MTKLQNMTRPDSVQ